MEKEREREKISIQKLYESASDPNQTHKKKRRKNNESSKITSSTLAPQVYITHVSKKEEEEELTERKQYNDRLSLFLSPPLVCIYT